MLIALVRASIVIHLYYPNITRCYQLKVRSVTIVTIVNYTVNTGVPTQPTEKDVTTYSSPSSPDIESENYS